ncbi:MAG: DMT family transporter [Marinosulfonomonas sp.]|nr:DMT family transporter [Marinosulfonomonas sp.]
MRGHIAMLSFSALIAGSFSLGALAANDIAPAALNSVRFLIAAIVIGGIAAATKFLDRRLMNAPWRFLILGGLFAIYFVLMFEGLKTATPVSSAAVFTLTPLISAAFGWLLLRQITTSRMALALTIGAVGAVWVIFRADLAALISFRVGIGEMIFFWGVVAHAIYTPMSRFLHRGEHPLAMTFGMLVAGFVLLTAYGWSDIRATDWANLPTIVWITIGYTSLVAGSATFTLLQYAILRLPAAKVMAYTYLTPSWVVLWEIGLGHGAPRALILLGVAMTVVALVMLLKDEG